MALSGRIKTLRTDISTMATQAKNLYTELEGKGDAATADDRTKLNNLIDQGTEKRKELTQLEALEGLSEVNEPRDEAKHKPDARGRGRKSWGQTVVSSEQFKAAQGRPSEGKMSPVQVPGNIKALYGGTSASGGALVDPDLLPEILDIVRQRPFTVIDLVNQSETQSDAVEYVEMDSRTNAAAPVAEYTSGNFGLKPESNLTFNLKTAPVKTIATWIAASRQILMDAPQLQSLVDTELRYMVRNVLETQMVSGDGTGQNFTGMLNTSGIQIRTMHATTPVGRGQLTTDTKMTTLRRAITDIMLEFYEATGILMNPADLEDLEISEYNANKYSNAFDPVTRRVWRTPVIETMAIPALTALVGNFALAATLWDRMQTEVRVGEPNDYFLRNAVAVLGELRAAFAVKRPKALEKVTMI